MSGELIERQGFAPCPTCRQYSRSIGTDDLAEAHLHFETMIAHPVRGHPMGDAFDAKTRDMAQRLIADNARLRALLDADPEIQMARAALAYDPETGVLRWRTTFSRTKAGDVAGASDGKGYLHVGFLGRKYPAQRLAFAIHYGRWPNGLVDHINCDPLDNRIANLREATLKENARNRPKGCNNTSGFKGVYARASGTFSASIFVGGKNLHLGTFATAEEAAHVYDAAAIKHFGEFAYVNLP